MFNSETPNTGHKNDGHISVHRNCYEPQISSPHLEKLSSRRLRKSFPHRCSELIWFPCDDIQINWLASNPLPRHSGSNQLFSCHFYFLSALSPLSLNRSSWTKCNLLWIYARDFQSSPLSLFWISGGQSLFDITSQTFPPSPAPSFPFLPLRRSSCMRKSCQIIH